MMIEQKNSSQLKDYSLENLTQIDIGEVTLPQGIQVSKNQKGHCIVAQKQFKVNSQIDPQYKCLKVPINIQKIKMTIKGVEYLCDKSNTILTNTFRYFPMYNSFLNHSCDPNTEFIQNIKRGVQSWRVIKQIKVGQEITCNYLNFYYDGDQSEQFLCTCGSANCFKYIKGFKYLSFEDKIKILPILCQQTKKSWLTDQKNIILIEDIIDSYPLQLQIVNQKEYSLMSKVNFKINDIIFKYLPFKVMQDSILIIKYGECYKKIDVGTESPDKKGQIYFDYLRTLVKYSNSPNMKIQLQGQYHVGVCIEDIKVGQQLTIYRETYTQNN